MIHMTGVRLELPCALKKLCDDLRTYADDVEEIAPEGSAGDNLRCASRLLLCGSVRLKEIMKENHMHKEPLSVRLRENGWEGDTSSASEIADQIDNEYLLLPCDRDGNPWHIGDKFVYNGEEHFVYGVRVVSDPTYEQDYWSLISYEGVPFMADMCSRPSPDILDGDDNPISLDDTVWSVDPTCSESGKVVGFEGNKFVSVLWESEESPRKELGGNIVTNKPDYDADGVRLKPGDEVWSIYSFSGPYDTGDMMIVRSVDRGSTEVDRALGGAKRTRVNSNTLTHDKPVFDSEGDRLTVNSFACWVKDGEHEGPMRVTRAGNGTVDLVALDGRVFDSIDGKVLIRARAGATDLGLLDDMLASCSDPSRNYTDKELRHILREVENTLAIIKNGME